jgi:DeoR/GlpR family transcriptional regulator of sugar metabolism
MQLTTEQRRENIVALIHELGRVKVSELSEKYKISEVSVRKDLETLEAQGHLKRVHGGAVALNKLYVNMDLSERYLTNSQAKRQLAEAVATFVNDNDTIFMNAGTTLTYVLRAIKGKQNISLVTNSIQNATEAALFSSFKVILLGGEVDSKYQFTYGTDAEAQLANYHAMKTILSVDGISAEAGLTLYYSNEASIARKMIEYSSKTIVVADSGKIGKEVFARITDAKRTDILITNASDKEKELAALRKLGVTIYET